MPFLQCAGVLAGCKSAPGDNVIGQNAIQRAFAATFARNTAPVLEIQLLSSV